MATVLFGGTFDPFHLGHVELCRAIAEETDFDHLIFVPNKQPVHKSAPLLSAKDRVTLLRHCLPTLPNRATKPIQYTVSDYEVSKNTPSWTRDTIRNFQEASPLYFLMGSDSFFNLHTWREPEDILSRVTVLVYPRDTHEQDVYDAYMKQHFSGVKASFKRLSCPVVSISSTEIREALAANNEIEHFVPGCAIDFLRKRVKV